MKFLCPLAFFLLISLFGKSQNIEKEIKGKWIINSYQAAGEYGLTNQIADMFIGDTVIIRQTIWHSVEQNEFSKALGLKSEKCTYNPTNILKIENPEVFFLSNYKAKPSLLLANETNNEIYLIETDCPDLFYKNIFFNKSDNTLMFFQEGMYFFLKRIEF